MSKQHKCPNCGKLVTFSSLNKWRPFCSERCSLIDLGEWISGNHKISSDVIDDDHKPDDSDFIKH